MRWTRTAVLAGVSIMIAGLATGPNLKNMTRKLFRELLAGPAIGIAECHHATGDRCLQRRTSRGEVACDDA